MDDNPAQPTHNGIPLDVTPDPTSTGLAPVTPQTAPPVAPNIPPSPPPKLKESEPVSQEADRIAKGEGDEYWENYAREIELEKEIAEIGGIEKVESGEVKVSPEIAEKMGIKPTVTAQTPIKNVIPDFSVRGVALSDGQLGAGLTKPTSSGFRWLVEWFIYQLLKAHYFVKRVGGKIFRSKPSPSPQPSGSPRSPDLV